MQREPHIRWHKHKTIYFLWLASFVKDLPDKLEKFEYKFGELTFSQSADGQQLQK